MNDGVPAVERLPAKFFDRNDPNTYSPPKKRNGWWTWRRVVWCLVFLLAIVGFGTSVGLHDKYANDMEDNVKSVRATVEPTLPAEQHVKQTQASKADAAWLETLSPQTTFRLAEVNQNITVVWTLTAAADFTSEDELTVTYRGSPSSAVRTSLPETWTLRMEKVNGIWRVVINGDTRSLAVGDLVGVTVEMPATLGAAPFQAALGIKVVKRGALDKPAIYSANVDRTDEMNYCFVVSIVCLATIIGLVLGGGWMWWLDRRDRKALKAAAANAQNGEVVM